MTFGRLLGIPVFAVVAEDVVEPPVIAVAATVVVVGGGAIERSVGNHWVDLLVAGVVSVERVVAAKAFVFVDKVSSGALLFSVPVDSCLEVEVADGREVRVGIRAGFEIVLESVLIGRLATVEFPSEIIPVGMVGNEVKEEIKEGPTGRDPFVWTGSGASVAKVGIFDNILDKMGRSVNVGSIDCKVEGIPDMIGTLSTLISKKETGKN